jgi:CheY-like chemotaxis protein
MGQLHKINVILVSAFEINYLELITTTNYPDTSGKECLNKYTEEKTDNKINVLLLDYRLDDMTGNYVVCKIGELNSINTILIMHMN